MSVTVEISNPANLQRVRSLLNTNSDNEAVDVALERVIEIYELPTIETKSEALPDEFWDDLFSEPPLPREKSLSQAVIEERHEDRF